VKAETTIQVPTRSLVVCALTAPTDMTIQAVDSTISRHDLFIIISVAE
jgi:hypothetical protein